MAVGSNIAMTAGRLDASGVWDLEDEEALASAQLLIKQHYERTTKISKVECPLFFSLKSDGSWRQKVENGKSD
jgi:hypothetical protein